jgi:MSHA biogenesis protein MshG
LSRLANGNFPAGPARKRARPAGRDQCYIPGVPLRQRIRFYQQLAVLTRAGVPLRTGLARLQERIPSPQLSALAEQISLGQPVGRASAAAGFSPFECNLITAGERSAQLDAVFQHLAEFWSRQHEMYEALTRQLYYPFVIMVLAVLLGAGADLLFDPWPEAIAHLVETVALYGTFFFVVYTLVRASWTSETAQRFWLAVPIIGPALSTAYAYRWITALKLEHGAGIARPDAVADAWRASGFVDSRRHAEEGELELREGAELSALMQRWSQLPRDWVDFIETGEISGALEAAFASLEGEAALAWQAAQGRMTQWVPKILYFFALLIVGVQIILDGVRLYAHILNPINAALNPS